MDTKLLEEFIEELKNIEPENKASCNPKLMRSQIFVINEIIAMAEKKVATNKNIKINQYAK